MVQAIELVIAEMLDERSNIHEHTNQPSNFYSNMCNPALIGFLHTNSNIFQPHHVYMWGIRFFHPMNPDPLERNGRGRVATLRGLPRSGRFGRRPKPKSTGLPEQVEM